MSSTYSPSLRIELIGSGDQAGTWGTTTDNNFAYIFDSAIAGYQAVTVTSTAQALTYVNGPTSSAALNQSIYAMLKLNGAAAASAIYAPPVSKTYILWNNSSYTITIYNSTVIGNTTAAGTGIAIAAGNKIMVWSDGTNFYDLQAQSLTGTLAIANGGTGQTTANAAFNALAPAQTANRLLRSDGTNTSFAQAALATDVTGTLPVANGGTGVTTAAAITALVGNLLFPIGAIYTATVATNPGTLLGFGTWTAFSAGRVMIGDGGGFSAGATGGSADAVVVSHTHTFSATTGNTDLSHTHQYGSAGNWGSGAANAFDARNSNSFTSSGASISMNHSHSVSGTTASAGSSPTNANLQPYIVVYMWQRTA
jgi:hypothetical protein